MLNDLVTIGMTADECRSALRKARLKIGKTMGVAPDFTIKPKYEILKKYTGYGLEHRLISYKVLPTAENRAVLVLPKNFDASKKYPCVLCLHGTTLAGKLGNVDPVKSPHRAYGIELAQKGYAAFVPDQYPFGDYCGPSCRDLHGTMRKHYESFYRKYPKWSIDGRRLWDMQRALDVIETMKFIDSKNIGAIGNSLGGRSVMYITAFDRRIKAAVSSTGVSPNATNIYRNITGLGKYNSPLLSENMRKTGKPVFDYHEMISLCAPRAL